MLPKTNNIKKEDTPMTQRRGASERLSQLQAAILQVIARGEIQGKGGAYGSLEIADEVRRSDVTHYLSMSFRRAMANLGAKGLIEPIPYWVRGERCGQLWGLSAKARALVLARGLVPPHLLAQGHPARVDLP
jgi:hypothetical protein